jgi:outer membrane protein TolC
MRRFSSTWRRLCCLAAGPLVLAGPALATSPGFPAPVHTAVGPVLQTPAQQPSSAAPARRVLALPTCLAIALQKQPSVAAARASLAAAVARQQAVEKLGGLSLLQRDLRARKQQAALGVLAAQAGVTLAEMDTIYAVQFCYVSYLYAKEQDEVANEVLEDIESDKKAYAELPRDLQKLDPDRDLARIDAFLHLARARKQEASVGMRRALSALAEAMGLECSSGLELADEKMFNGPFTVRCEEMVALALQRRPEILQASVGLEVADLEVSAQAARPLALTLRTFAIGADIHAQALPSARLDGEYVPGPLHPEMPVTINGWRSDRVEQAKIYQDRSASVLEKTRNLVRLQTEQTVLRLKDARDRVVHLRAATEQARTARNYFRREYKSDPKHPRLSERLTDRLRTARFYTEMRVLQNEARYQILLALVALERATVGGFRAGLGCPTPSANKE